MTRQIVLDTETTGLEPSQGHRIIEIGCVELINRRLTGNNYHQYLQPDRAVDEGALQVHGISNEFLQDKPRFSDIADDLMNYLKDAELIIHNAPFDVGFLDHELKLLGDGRGVIGDHCSVTDTLVMARKMHPGQKNNLDALCKRYDVSNTHRDLHGALLDAEILADVYLRMTGGQVGLALDSEQATIQEDGATMIARISTDRPPLRIVAANEDESTAHAEFLKKMGDACLWQ